MALRGVFLSLLLFLLSLPSNLFALGIPSRPQGYVSDYAGMLSPASRAKLEEKLRQFEAETSNQVVVATFPSLEGEELEDFSIRLAEAWKIGQKGKDNGVILLIFKQDRAVRIEVGYGLEGALPDATCKLIIENEIVPNFRQGKFDEGVEKAVDVMMAAAKGEYHPETATPLKNDGFRWPIFILSFFLGAFLPLVLLRILFFAGLSLGLYFLVRTFYFIAFLSLMTGTLPLLFHFLFGRLRNQNILLDRHGDRGHNEGFFAGGWGGGGSDGGGFSGGGGGSFGGGGASGGW